MDEKEVRALTIAPGGNIIQHIERDSNDPRTWDIANSKVINVQLIDSRTFQLVTGMSPPTTPVTPDVYKKLGLPFFSLWRDETKEAGVSGTWGTLKGAKQTATWNMKSNSKLTGSSNSPSEGSVYGETGTWGLLSSNSWAANETIEEEEQEYTEPSFEFPIELIDVDDTLPRFRSILDVQDNDDEWDEEEMYD